MVKRQAEEGEKRAPHKVRAQRNLKLKTRARIKKRARKQKRKRNRIKSTVKLKLQVKPVNLIHFRYEALDSREQRVARLWDLRPAPPPWPAS